MYCLTCGYNLNGLADHRCPECGQGFDPGRPKSFGQAKTNRLLHWARVAGWLTGLVAVGTGATAAVGIATGRYDIMLVIAAWAIGFMPLTVAAMVYLICLSTCQRWPSMRAFIIALLLFVFNVSLVTEWPIRVSFLLHRDGLNQHAQQCIQNPAAITTPTHIGLFTIDPIYTKPNLGGTHVIFQISRNTGSPDYLVYGVTDAEIKAHFNIWSFKRLDADWHIVHED